MERLGENETRKGETRKGETRRDKTRREETRREAKESSCKCGMGRSLFLLRQDAYGDGSLPLSPPFSLSRGVLPLTFSPPVWSISSVP